jgi:hypothetical protein
LPLRQKLAQAARIYGVVSPATPNPRNFTSFCRCGKNSTRRLGSTELFHPQPPIRAISRVFAAATKARPGGSTELFQNFFFCARAKKEKKDLRLLKPLSLWTFDEKNLDKRPPPFSYTPSKNLGRRVCVDRAEHTHFAASAVNFFFSISKT